MKRIFKIVFIGFIVFCFTNCKSVSSSENSTTKLPKVEFDFSNTKENNFPRRLSLVSDYEVIFSVEELVELTEIINDFQEETGNQIAVASINSIGNYDNFDKYTIDLSNFWGVGNREKNNGLTIIFSKKLKKVRITTGIGTEKILTDSICKIVIDKKIIPEFKKGNYYKGVKKGLLNLIEEWK